MYTFFQFLFFTSYLNHNAIHKKKRRHSYIHVFLQFYLQARLSWRGARLLRPLIQFLLVMIAVYTGLTRISDYRHHPTDVLTGFIQGGLTAYWVVRSKSHRLLEAFVRIWVWSLVGDISLNIGPLALFSSAWSFVVLINSGGMTVCVCGLCICSPTCFLFLPAGLLHLLHVQTLHPSRLVSHQRVVGESTVQPANRLLADVSHYSGNHQDKRSSEKTGRIR